MSELERLLALEAPDVEDALEAVREVRATDRDRWQRLVVACLDLTSLRAEDTARDVERLAARALAPADGWPPCAAVCVFPVFVPTVRRALGDGPVKLASVAGAFPHGQLPLALRTAEVRWVVDQGADEVDVVVRRGQLLAGELDRVHDDLAALVEAAGGATVKVILETGGLPDARVWQGALVALAAGAHFLKTSTGTSGIGATPRAGALLLRALRTHHAATGEVRGYKASGGLRTPEDAWVHLALVARILGSAWLHPDRLRLGASSLLDAVLADGG
ncbi:MAG: deoxyribose-phosphate aldolase [Alphaproteobacteria bacterium]|nr:deoxyribose-phosphate aldolase [Alphaproteobacteria bacterium]